MRIVVLGATGQIGQGLTRSLASLGEVIPASRAAADLSIPGSVDAYIRARRPNVVVNAAAYTAVDRAESDTHLCHRVNALAVRELAEAARDIGALLVHYSTDYVFDGSKNSPYVEDDPANPLNVYGASKLAGEQAVRDVGGPHVVLRTSWVYGPRGNNFFRTILRMSRERSELRVVADQVGAPTSSDVVAAATRDVIARLASRGELLNHAGTYHATAAGQASWYEFACAIVAGDPLRCHDREVRVAPIATHDYPTAARRPRYSVLDNGKLRRSLGVELPNWRESLDGVLAAMPR